MKPAVTSPAAAHLGKASGFFHRGAARPWVPFPSLYLPTAPVADRDGVNLNEAPMHGTKFDRNRSTSQKAQAIRADLKAAQKARVLSPALRISVTTSLFSGGSSISVRVQSTPFLVLNHEYVEACELDPHTFHANAERYTRKGRELLLLLEDMAEAYRRDDSDSSVDYFNCNFYLTVSFGHEMEGEEREMMIAALRARMTLAEVMQ